MSELIGFEYNAKNKKISTINSLWTGELLVYPFNDEYRLCIKLPVNTFIREGNKNRSINAYDILEEKFYNLYEHDEVFKFCGKIRIKGENVYGRANEFSLTTSVLYDVYIKLPNEIEKDAGINPAYKANDKYNVLTFYHDACYFNTEYINNESWELLTHESKTPIKNNGEVEIKINEELSDGILGVDLADVPF